MIKRILVVAAILMMAAVVGGFAGQTQIPDRGEWNGRTYTNEFLGLTFEIPAGWMIFSDAQIAEAFGIGADLFDLDFDEVESAIVMMATNLSTGANVNIVFERLPPRLRITGSEYLSIGGEQIESIGGVITPIAGTTRIGAYDWYSHYSEVAMQFQNRQFATIKAGFAAIITITYFNDVSEVYEILSFFGSN